MTSDVSAQPDDGIYIHKIRVSWADCDPANIAYTGRLPNFALDAIDSWWLVHFGEDWYRLNLERDFATPFVHLEMDLRKPVTPLHPLLIALRLAKLGTSSFTFAFVARQNNEVCFEGRFVCVAATTSSFNPIPIPDYVRARIGHLERPD